MYNETVYIKKHINMNNAEQCKKSNAVNQSQSQMLFIKIKSSQNWNNYFRLFLNYHSYIEMFHHNIHNIVSLQPVFFALLYTMAL